MRLSSRLMVLACLASLAFNGAALAEGPPFDVRDVREVRYWLLNTGSHEPWRKEYQYLLHMGEKVFPAYKAILSDPKSSLAGCVFDILSKTEADRRCFIKYAVARLTDEWSHLRHHAVALLERIGSPTEASLLIALLSDKEFHVAHGAARALAAIGGPNEVVAMDVWLRGVSHRNDADLRQEVQRQRDELKKRLDEAKDPKKRAQTIQRCWKDLRITEWVDQDEVHRAVWQLTAFGNETVSFLKKHLHAATQKHLNQLLADLDSNSFDRRAAATRELSRGIVVESVLEKALANHPSLELRRRLEAILEDMPDWRKKNPELLRSIRAIWVLQQIGTPAAKALLEKLAAGAPAARLTQKAKDALASLKKG